MQAPKFKVSNKQEVPSIGFGTFGSDHASAEEVMESVRLAIKNGFTHIDCASCYGNEKEIGIVLKEAMDGKITGKKIKREDLWITGKLWNDKHAKEDVIPSLKQSLSDLQLDYLDLYLVHWPFPNYHPPKCDVTTRSDKAKPFILEDFMTCWKEMEKACDLSLVKNIGVSNVTIAKMEAILPECRIKPTFIEMELHPTFQQPELRAYAKSKDMTIIGFCPLGSPNRPDRDKMEGDAVDMADPIVVEIAKKHNVHPAEICLKWAHANNIIPIPFSTKERNILSNLRSVCENDLTPDEVEKLKGVDQNCRLVKGPVFLWKSAKDWHDLWDEDGTITK
jgi:diketogulonate reductase-like aldo/keto reductase